MAERHVLLLDLANLFPKRPLISGESAQEYDALLCGLATAVKPTDVLEAMWVRTWSMKRERPSACPDSRPVDSPGPLKEILVDLIRQPSMRGR